MQLLGDVAVRVGDTWRSPGGPIPRTILALLAVTAPSAVPRDRLIDGAWGDDPPGSASSTLQAHVSKLRRRIEPDIPTGEPSLIVTAGSGYRLDLAPRHIDVGRFRTAAAEASTPEEWARAVELGAGDPLPGCVDSWPVVAERRALREEWLHSVEAWAAACLDHDRPDEVIDELERLTHAHPLRERLWELLVRGLGGAGRRSDALETYQRARQILVEEVGLEPGPGLEQAQRDVLGGDRRGNAGLPVADAAVRGIPAPRTTLVGREEEHRTVAHQLAVNRLVTITGPGGVGKTQTAMAVARRVHDRFHGGAIFVDLTGVDHDEEVVSAIAAACGVQLSGSSGDLPGIAARLGPAPSLLLVDNCEHVPGGARATIDALLDMSEHLTVLATSRHPLGIGGEHVLRLQPLPRDDAIRLFMERAEARRPGAVQGRDSATIDELCERLDRLPLAIELAAAQIDHLPLTVLLEQARERADTLSRLEPADDRHRSLEATIRWSYDLLDPAARQVLRRLGVFHGSPDLEQIRGVTDRGIDDRELRRALGTLVTHSLVVADHTAGTVRYRLLETVRAFARSELDAHGEAVETRRLHRRWYIDWAQRRPTAEGLVDLAAAWMLRRHHDDLLAAADDARASSAAGELVDLAMLASGLAFTPGGLPDAARCVTVAVDHCPDDDPRYADLRTVAAYTTMLQSELPRTLEHLDAVFEPATANRFELAPLALALNLLRGTEAQLTEAADTLLATDEDEVRTDVRQDLRSIRPLTPVLRTQEVDRALAEAEGAWSRQPWDDRRTLAGWTIHAALLHVTARDDELEARLHDTEGVPPTPPGDGRPPSYFRAFFLSLVEAARGNRTAALGLLRSTWQQYPNGIPGIDAEMLGAAGIVERMCGDDDRARWLLDRRELRARHPGTAIVHVHHRTELGLSVKGFGLDWWTSSGDDLSDVLPEALGAG